MIVLNNFTVFLLLIANVVYFIANKPIGIYTNTYIQFKQK